MFARARRDGTIELDLDPVVRTVVRQVCAELRANIEQGADHPTLRRLFPAAYAHDPARERAYEQLVRDDLVNGRLAALDTVERTIDAPTITREEAETWMTAINAARLALGTQLDVSENRDLDDVDVDDPRHTQFVVYDLLSLVLGSLIAAVGRS